MIDDKLKEILEKQIYSPGDGERLFFTLQPTIAQIKQCFLEAGWKEPDEQNTDA